MVVKGPIAKPRTVQQRLKQMEMQNPSTSQKQGLGKKIPITKKVHDYLTTKRIEQNNEKYVKSVFEGERRSVNYTKIISREQIYENLLNLKKLAQERSPKFIEQLTYFELYLSHLIDSKSSTYARIRTMFERLALEYKSKTKQNVESLLSNVTGIITNNTFAQIGAVNKKTYSGIGYLKDRKTGTLTFRLPVNNGTISAGEICVEHNTKTGKTTISRGVGHLDLVELEYNDTNANLFSTITAIIHSRALNMKSKFKMLQTILLTGPNTYVKRPLQTKGPQTTKDLEILFDAVQKEVADINKKDFFAVRDLAQLYEKPFRDHF